MESEPFRTSLMRATPFPNRLLELAATLPETQARIVCVVARMTLGWSAGSAGLRQSSVLLSVRQIQRRVGRVSAMPVVEAVVALARSGVIVVAWQDGSGVYPAQLAEERGRPLRVGIARGWVEENGGG